MFSAAFFAALGAIILIDLLLAGDHAIVIAPLRATFRRRSDAAPFCAAPQAQSRCVAP